MNPITDGPDADDDLVLIPVSPEPEPGPGERALDRTLHSAAATIAMLTVNLWVLGPPVGTMQRAVTGASFICVLVTFWLVCRCSSIRAGRPEVER